MSGGAFDYVYLKNLDQIGYSLEDLDSLAAFLRERGKEEAAKEVEAYKEKAAGFAKRLKELEEAYEAEQARIESVLRAAEWWASNDWGEDTFDRYWEEFKKGDSR